MNRVEKIRQIVLPAVALCAFLARGEWKPVRPTGEPMRLELDEGALPAVAETSARTLLTDEAGHSAVKPDYHGRLIRLQGIVRSMPSGEDGRLYLADGDFLVPVDVGAVSDVFAGLAFVQRGVVLIIR